MTNEIKRGLKRIRVKLIKSSRLKHFLNLLHCKETLDWTENHTFAILIKSCFFLSKIFSKLINKFYFMFGLFRYEFWMHCIFIILIPWVFIAVLNLLIVKFILKTSNNIKYLMSSDSTGTTGLSVSKASHEKRNMKVEQGLESPISNSEKAFNRRQDQVCINNNINMSFDWFL